MTATARRALNSELRQLQTLRSDTPASVGDIPDPDDPGRTVDERIAELQDAFSIARVVPGVSRAAVGTTVRASRDGRSIDYAITIGHDGHSTPRAATVCARTSTGRALLGRRKGALVVAVDGTGHTRHMRITEIRETL